MDKHGQEKTAPEVQAQERPSKGMHVVTIDDRRVALDGKALLSVMSYELKKPSLNMPAELTLRLLVHVGSDTEVLVEQ